jgi:outer membrane protein OmpA-like peptidoglycan-associated protein
MNRNQLNEEDNEIKKRAHDLYARYHFKDGNDFVDWLVTKRHIGQRARLTRRKQLRRILIPIIGLLSVMAVILIVLLFRTNSQMELAKKSLADMNVMVLMVNKNTDEQMLVFGDTYFDFNQSALKPEAQLILKKNIQLLRENPKIKIRVAGYTSAKGTEAINQKLSENRASAVKSFLMNNGIAAERLTTIGYGRAKPAFYEVSPGNAYTREAKANMRVLFEIVME